jgi:hypothetical protein
MKTKKNKQGFKYSRLFIIPLLAFFATGCISLSGQDLVDKHAGQTSDFQKQIQETSQKRKLEQQSIFFHSDNMGSLNVIDKETEDKKNATWLKRKISLKVLRPISAKGIVRMLRDNNVNITSSLPLDGYLYSGFGVSDVEIGSALKYLFGSMGLDYKIDFEHKMISILPMQWKTYYVNVGNRTTSYNTGEGLDSDDDENSDDDDSGIETNTLSSGEGLIVESKDDFWKALEKNIKARLTILIPNSNAQQANVDSSGLQQMMENFPINDPIAATAASATIKYASNADGLFKEISIGRFALNPEVGSIQIQAPYWMHEELFNYFQRINDMYDTQIHFEGKLFMITKDDAESRGLDINLFKEVSKSQGWNLLFTNNALGGVTIKNPEDGMPGVSVGDLIGGGTGLFGITANDNTLQMFHSFLEENSNVAVLQEPSLTTTSGVPAKFQKFETRYYNTVSEEASGTDVSAVGVSNKLVPVKFGSLLSINPRYDVEKDLVRAQISFEQSLNSGEQLVIQTVSSKDVPTTIPIVSEATYSGEALLKDGDMIIIGGQKETISNFTDSGMIGVKDTFLSPLVGKKKYVNREITYYFALQMHIEKQ